MDQYEMIRTSCRVYGENISEMSRITGHSRNTIKKAIRGEPWGYKERAHQPFPALEKYLKIIDGWLTDDKYSPKKQCNNGVKPTLFTFSCILSIV